MLMSHYAIMHAQEEVLDRTIPIPVFVFHVTLKLTHSGLTAKEALELDDRQFGTFYPQTAQITCDSGLTPYERDFSECMKCSQSEGLQISQTTTENIVSPLLLLFFWTVDCSNPTCMQACPCNMAQMAGRVVRNVVPIEVARGTPIAQIMAKFDTPLTHTGTRLLNERVHFMAEQALTPWELPEMYTNIVMDDCETTSLLGRMALKTSLLIGSSSSSQVAAGGMSVAASPPTTAQVLRDACQHWPIFKHFTGESWDLMAKIIDRGNVMLRCNHLRVMATVGLASTPSASDSIDRSPSLNGHCFNVGFLKTPSMETPECMLLEGTACMIQYKVTETTPKVTVTLSKGPGEPGLDHTFDMASFLTLFVGTVLYLTAVINSPNGGGEAPHIGMPFKRKISGWLGKTMVMKTLDSSPCFPLPFYNRILYCGWPCTDDGLGCMPVEECDGEILAGCHPYSLPHQDLRGISAGIPPEQFEIMRQVMDESTPPMADDSLFEKLSSFWEPCEPLEKVNKDLQLPPGVKYTRVVSMETPGAPEYIPLIYEAKRQLVGLTNEINRKLPDSDGIVGHVKKLATGVHVLVDVPNRSFRLTYMRSMKQALATLNWPAAVPPVKDGLHH